MPCLGPETGRRLSCSCFETKEVMLPVRALSLVKEHKVFGTLKPLDI